VEIDDLMMRLISIEKEMPVEDKAEGNKRKGIEDRFVEAKSEFLLGVTKVKDVSCRIVGCAPLMNFIHRVSVNYIMRILVRALEIKLARLNKFDKPSKRTPFYFRKWRHFI